MVPTVELTHILPPWVSPTPRMVPFDFQLAGGDACAIESESADDAHRFLKMLATLLPPAGGEYRFQGELLDFTDYRRLLPVKRRIAYIAPDAALISNRNIRENLLLMRYYHENDLSIDLDPEALELCRILGVDTKLTMIPSALHRLEVQRVITIRELTKPPALILLERPEDFIWQTDFHDLHPKLKGLMISDAVPMVFFSYDPEFVEEFATRIISIRAGGVTHRPIQE